MDKLRIAVLGTRGIPDVQGGVEKHCEELYPRLVSKGCEVRLYARKGYVAPHPTVFKGVEVFPLWAPRKKSLEAIVHTFIALLHVCANRRDFDFVHIHAIGPSMLAPLARMLGLKVIVTNHGPDYDRQKWGWFAKSMLRLGEQLGARYSSSVITVSNHIRNMLLDKCSSDPTYIPNGVDIAEKKPAGEFLEQHGLEAGKYILAVGRLVPEKGFHDLLEAYSSSGTKWKLAIAGDADHDNEYSRSLKKKAGGTPGVVMTGFIKGGQLRELFSNAGLFVMPSYHEGLPIAALEAMSYGIPMLLSSIPANMELALDGETFPPGEPDKLADAIVAFLNDPEKIFNEEIASAKSRRLESEFDWDRISEQTLQVYKRVLNTGLRAAASAPTG